MRKNKGFRLGTGEKRFVVATYDAAVERRIQGYLDMHSTLATMKITWTVATYAENVTHAPDGMTRCRPVQLATPSVKSYNRSWTYRCYQMGEGRAHGVQRPRYGPHDTVAMLPAPDTIDQCQNLVLRDP